jgi:hypothetical protein
LVYPRKPGFSKKSLLLANCRFSVFYTLSATRLPTAFPPALGFACRPCDRFAFVEDEEAAGPIRTTSRLLEKYVNTLSG